MATAVRGVMRGLRRRPSSREMTDETQGARREAQLTLSSLALQMGLCSAGAGHFISQRQPVRFNNVYLG